MRLKISFLRYHWICVNCVASSGEIQIFQERVVALQVSLTTGSLIITVSRGKPCWLSQYKCKVDLCVANWYSLVLRPTPLRGPDTLVQITQPRETRTKTCYHSAIGSIVNATIT